MVSLSGRPLTGSSPRYPGSTVRGIGSAGGALRMLGRRRMTKFRFRMMMCIYLALGCIVPYYVMKHAEQDELVKQRQQHEQHQDAMILQEQERQHRQQEEIQLQRLHGFSPPASRQSDGRQTLSVEGPGIVSEDNPRGYRRRPFFEDLVEVETPATDQSSLDDQQKDKASKDSSSLEGTVPLLSGSVQHKPEPAFSYPTEDHIRYQKETQTEVLREFINNLELYQAQFEFKKVKTVESYNKKMDRVVSSTQMWVQNKLPEELRFTGEQEMIPGTRLNTPQKAKRFRALMDQALNAGRWVYEPQRDYPDFGGATGWNKKKLNERDRDVAIDRPPFPEAGKYYWEPLPGSDSGASLSGSTGSSPKQQYLGGMPSGSVLARHGWHANRISPEDFCSLLGPRHIVLVGDLIHWQLHDSIMYNMFDTPQACYGDLACHIGVGHPLCPLPDDVRLKFVRNDQLSTVRLRKSKGNETKTQDPVEMPWLKDVKLKDTIILGATHHAPKDQLFRRQLADALIKIRIKRPEALIIYRNNPVGHPECPSKANGFNSHKDQERQRTIEKLKLKQKYKQQWQQRQQQQQQQINSTAPPSPPKKKWTRITHDNLTFAAAPKPFDQDIPLGDMLDYPLNWAHYDRQNNIAKVIVEAAGGIYWNVATMTNMRPDGHVGGQDCLGYKRPGPTDEWAVSLYNMFKTIDQVEREMSTA
ncbi:hypothetical protein EMPS_04372 [Entomortierella parvispora]|uniref:Uncharacterized protein n=1 Tax=Entomortierella parvispora TaxID=205924 RepID=A0A9P3H8F8_9FUNG|nr:hypothetical protein EMPS_04372 [Entomortierella parvispora]